MHEFYNNFTPALNSRPTIIINEEINWDKDKTIVSTTDLKGVILYANEAFVNTSEYRKMELLGEHQSILRHPDMPKITFKLLWIALHEGRNFHAIIKNLTRNGRYYWVITDFTINKNKEGKPTGYTARRKSVPQGVIDKITPIYKDILEIEKQKGDYAAETFFTSYLEEEIGKPYEEFVLDLFEEERKKEEKKNASFFGKVNPFKKSMNWFFNDDK